MYPLDMKLVEGIGFAVANSEAEHKALTKSGYGPAFVPAKAEELAQDPAPKTPAKAKA